MERFGTQMRHMNNSWGGADMGKSNNRRGEEKTIIIQNHDAYTNEWGMINSELYKR